MKTFDFFKTFLFIVCLIFITACSDDDNKETPTVEEQILFGDGTQFGNGDQQFKIYKDHTIRKGTYVMKGWIYVQDGATLTIEPGTVIKGDKDTKASLIIERGAKLIAKGTANLPIVFTSNQAVGRRKPGDWGGIILLGKAKNNKTEMQIEGGVGSFHGGSNDDDNSGVLSYVRCEFPGYPFVDDQEINGITFGSVGRGTQVDHVQVSYSNDDSYEWFGGSVNAKYLVAYHGWDDDFDTDNGFSGRLQFLLAVRHPKIADTSYSNSFESDNNGDGTATEPFTSVVFSNVTLVGPIGQDADFVNNSQYIDGGGFKPNNNSKLGSFQSAMQIRRNSRLSCFNSVAIGYPVGLVVENDKGSTTQTWASNGNLKLQNLYFAGMGVLGSDVNKKLTDQYSNDGGKTIDDSRVSFSSEFFKLSSNKNTYYTNVSDLQLGQPNSLANSPNYGPKSGSPLTGLSNLFTDALLQSGFDKVNYVGAFKSNSDSDNWMKGWTNFDPQNTVY